MSKIVDWMLCEMEFKKLFDTYFDAIRSFVYYRCGDPDIASDIAQDVFMKLWEKRMQLDTGNLKSLLYKIANDLIVTDYRKSLSHINFVQCMTVEEYDDSPEEQLQFEELKKQYSAALNEMTPQQRDIFLMSRNDELKYHEISERLGISVKTVEKHMSTALRHIRKVLNVYQLVLLCLFYPLFFTPESLQGQHHPDLVQKTKTGWIVPIPNNE